MGRAIKLADEAIPVRPSGRQVVVPRERGKGGGGERRDWSSLGRRRGLRTLLCMLWAAWAELIGM